MNTKVNGVRKITRNPSGKFGLHWSSTFHCCLFWPRLSEGRVWPSIILSLIRNMWNYTRRTVGTLLKHHENRRQPNITGFWWFRNKIKVKKNEEEANIQNNSTIKYNVTVCMCLKHSHWATLNNIRLKREICKQIFWLSTPPPPPAGGKIVDSRHCWTDNKSLVHYR